MDRSSCSDRKQVHENQRCIVPLESPDFPKTILDLPEFVGTRMLFDCLPRTLSLENTGSVPAEVDEKVIVAPSLKLKQESTSDDLWQSQSDNWNSSDVSNITGPEAEQGEASGENDRFHEEDGFSAT